ncbi:hypothetical protein QI633_09595 [Nocardioides sp. QY071]|uniref:hypothetical protein n=1 Tax=Nocardioides sp. QY071 TaxID=3044187 RepID=UPI00249A3B1E|nr:hypothetical protein [Nocardioides sp. QY071]WGY04006.1 hypothetical protein QI633_09595 [Nocardioides sp. QY071]
MTENDNAMYPLGRSLTFVPEDGVEVEFRPAAISIADARMIGLTYCEASEPERDALLAALGGGMVRRSLRVFANTAARLGEPDAAAYARDLRDEIIPTPTTAEGVAS